MSTLHQLVSLTPHHLVAIPWEAIVAMELMMCRKTPTSTIKTKTRDGEAQSPDMNVG